jgi:hypothetical protein
MSEFGYKLDPNRKLRKHKGIKGTRRSIVNTYNPSTIDQGGILSVRFPDLGRHDVIVPGSAKLSFKFALTADNDANRTIVNNLGRAIVNKLEVKLEGQSVYTLNNSDIFHCYQDLWKTKNERDNAVLQGIQSEAGRKVRINAGDKGADSKDVAIGTAYSNLFHIPLDFELLDADMPFYQYELKDRLSYEITFNNYGRVIESSDATASYTISDISMEFEIVNSPELVNSLKMKHRGMFQVLYDRVVHHSKHTVNKSDSHWNFQLAPQSQSMKGILLIFIDPADGGANFARDSEKFYNPKITKVSTTIDGLPNQIYSAGMKPHQQFYEITKHFSDGKYRHMSNITKELELSDVSLGEYLTTKYALWLDMRSTDDNSLHGTGRKIEGASQSIQIEIEKTAETAGALDAHIFYISDAKIIFDEGRLKNVVF